jgi:hypothetical protein
MYLYSCVQCRRRSQAEIVQYTRYGTVAVQSLEEVQGSIQLKDTLHKSYSCTGNKEHLWPLKFRIFMYDLKVMGLTLGLT